jgi:neogenin
MYLVTKHTEHEIVNLNPYTKYKIWIVAYNQNGPGLNSEEVIVITKPSAPTQPPQNIVAEAISPTVYN